MPLYEYQCDNCGELFEVMQKFADEPLTTHEKCGGSVHRLLSAPALQFKGSGWYITDYAKNSKSGDNGSEKSKAKESAGTESSSGETSSKSEPAPAKAESKPSTTSETK